MKSERGEVVELFTADLTGELLKASVSVHVIVQVTAGLEGGVTDLTYVRPEGES